MVAGKRWTEIEEQKAKELLLSGQTCFEVSKIICRSWKSISVQNRRKWHIDLMKIDFSNKISRNLDRITRVDRTLLYKGHWSGEKNPNYGARIVKRGQDNPLSVWKRNNPGYQNGDKNPSFGRKYSQEEIDKKTKKMREFNFFRRGKTYKEIYGISKAAEISKTMSLGSAIRISKQKSSCTVPELDMMKKLDFLNIEYEFQYPIDFYCVDFFIPSKKLVLQVDGCYWHGCPTHFKDLDDRQKNRKRLDHSCDSFLKNRGYKIIRIWECKLPIIDIGYQIKSITEEEKCALVPLT